MVSGNLSRILILATAVVVPLLSGAGDDPRETRHELMESLGDAAKPVGGMLKGEVPFDEAKLDESLATFLDVSEKVGQYFPEGSGGGDSLAAPAIWEDRAGFDAALTDLHDAVTAAIAADPKSLDTARPVLGPIFNACKNCHDNYRLEDD